MYSNTYSQFDINMVRPAQSRDRTYYILRIETPMDFGLFQTVSCFKYKIPYTQITI